ncbi:MAG: helix-turn-helix transcriptional regulator [Clostridia bacterium]|nr:helix-turn-helix transcriptional regulator [Clostridia bacterium]
MNMVERLTALREDRDIKQSEIAAVLGCKQSAISKYERGRTRYSTEDVAKLCKFYNVSADYVLGLIDTPKPLK